MNDDSPKRIVRAWIEDWEEKAIGDDNVVSEQCILDKYKNLSFYDLDSDSTFTSRADKQLQWNRQHKREGIERGWLLLGVNENDKEEAFAIPFFIELFLDTDQPDDIEIIRYKKVSAAETEGDEVE